MKALLISFNLFYFLFDIIIIDFLLRSLLAEMCADPSLSAWAAFFIKASSAHEASTSGAILSTEGSRIDNTELLIKRHEEAYHFSSL